MPCRSVGSEGELAAADTGHDRRCYAALSGHQNHLSILEDLTHAPTYFLFLFFQSLAFEKNLYPFLSFFLSITCI
jgi:hypothetical protein